MGAGLVPLQVKKHRTDHDRDVENHGRRLADAAPETVASAYSSRAAAKKSAAGRPSCPGACLQLAGAHGTPICSGCDGQRLALSIRTSMITEDQTPVIDFLAAPSTHGGATVERIDTHASIVFLAGARAYKLKRAVRFDYLDFSTSERRRTSV